MLLVQIFRAVFRSLRESVEEALKSWMLLIFPDNNLLVDVVFAGRWSPVAPEDIGVDDKPLPEFWIRLPVVWERSEPLVVSYCTEYIGDDYLLHWNFLTYSVAEMKLASVTPLLTNLLRDSRARFPKYSS